MSEFESKIIHLEDLPPIYQDLAILRTVECNKTIINGNLDLLTVEISGLFVWESSNEGDQFWRDISEGKLPDISSRSIQDLIKAKIFYWRIFFLQELKTKFKNLQ